MQLKAARERSGKTQARVAKEAGIAEVSYQRYEYGRNDPAASIAVRIAKAVHSTVEELFDKGDGNT